MSRRSSPQPNDVIASLRHLFAQDSELPAEVDARNSLNDLPGKIWIQETKSVWKQRGLGASHPHTKYERMHPAPYSFQDVARLIAFFTKRGARVLDPFVGVGSTLKACAYLGREGTGVELSEKWSELALERIREETDCPDTQTVIQGDIREVLDGFEDESFDFIVTSPPYWSILNKTKDYKAQERIEQGLAHNYGSDDRDLGHIAEYSEFVAELAAIFGRCATKLKSGKYMVAVVSDFKHGDKFYPFHSDLSNALSQHGVALQGVTILEQGHKSLKPYGYPFAYVPNVHHQYLLIFRKAAKTSASKVVRRRRAQDAQLQDDQIYQGDVLELFAKVPSGTVDLIIADPPYNIGPEFRSGGNWQHDTGWVAWCKRWLDESKRVLSPDGAIFVYGIHNYLCYLQTYLYEIDLQYRRQFIWYYENGFSGFTRAPSAFYEPILWFSKGDTYTYTPIREPYKSTERLKNKITKNGKVWTPNPDGRHAGDVWQFPVLAGKRFAHERVDHPTQKPLDLTHRIVRHFSRPGDRILVPFAGSGTECVSAKMNDRRFIGFELSPEYVRLAEGRLAAAVPVVHSGSGSKDLTASRTGDAPLDLF
jgi:site-specific DNA-methyltransferase (adenine-specific)